MAAETRENSHFETSSVRGSAVDNLSFSIDSLQLGESTRSLLSPLYNRDATSRNSGSESELVEGEIVDKSTPNNSYSEQLSSQETVRKGRRNESSYNRSCSEKSSYSSSSRTASSFTSTPRKSFDNTNSESDDHGDGDGVKSKTKETKDIELSPWEKWLLKKVIKHQERTKCEIRKKKLEKEIDKKEKAEKMEKERKAEMNRQKWLEMKNQEERIRTELKRREEREKAERKLNEKEQMHEKAVESYRNWSEGKQKERKERIRKKKNEKLVKQEAENERKKQSEEAYERWLEKAMKHPKLTKTHFGYLSGKVTSYYDCTCYPMPSYNNPNPWVAPKVKRRNCAAKMELQTPSPPLLFKAIEQREQISKQNNSKLKVKKAVQ